MIPITCVYVCNYITENNQQGSNQNINSGYFGMLVNFYCHYGFPSFSNFLFLLNTDFHDRKIKWYISSKWDFWWALRRQWRVHPPSSLQMPLDKCELFWNAWPQMQKQNNHLCHLGRNLHEWTGWGSRVQAWAPGPGCERSPGPEDQAALPMARDQAGHGCEGRTGAQDICNTDLHILLHSVNITKLKGKRSWKIWCSQLLPSPKQLWYCCDRWEVICHSVFPELKAWRRLLVREIGFKNRVSPFASEIRVLVRTCSPAAKLCFSRKPILPLTLVSAIKEAKPPDNILLSWTAHTQVFNLLQLTQRILSTY